MLATVLCDNCGWKEDDQIVKEWFGKPCPVCGDIMVNSGDMIHYRIISILKAINGIIYFCFPWLEEIDVEAHSIDYHNIADDNIFRVKIGGFSPTNPSPHGFSYDIDSFYAAIKEPVSSLVTFGVPNYKGDFKNPLSLISLDKIVGEVIDYKIIKGEYWFYFKGFQESLEFKQIKDKISKTNIFPVLVARRSGVGAIKTINCLYFYMKVKQPFDKE